jgi:cardiolipin synthase
VELLAAALEKVEGLGGSPASLGVLGSLVPTEAFRAEVRRLLRAWGEVPVAQGAAVALALRAALAARTDAHNGSQVEVVWTGPEGEVDIRLTYAVLIELIETARRRLIIVSFAAYHVPEVLDVLRTAIKGGVEAWAIVDGGTEAVDALAGVNGLAVYTWPSTLLPDHDPRHASLHAKAAIADEKMAFVTSANLTGYALDKNIELGLLVRGGHVPALLARHFEGLIGRGELRELGAFHGYH